MQLKMLNKGKSKMRLELAGETHTFADILRNELAHDKRVKSVAYDKHHPQLGNPILILETEGEDPVATAKRASKNLAEQAREMRTEFEKALKKA
ncbi:MAG: DNA-directed RNA polymerase subunit L [Candidatus Aenigmarchaeota archaeon]|nr:DNA-directed RNA polymerase subunit L [Candidatus Aenigmarchaeota archaeon]